MSGKHRNPVVAYRSTAGSEAPWRRFQLQHQHSEPQGGEVNQQHQNPSY